MNEQLIPLEWHNEKRKWSELIPWEPNPRQMSPKEVEDLKASMSRFNVVETPAIDIDNTLVSGHQRSKVMALLGRQDEVTDVRVPNRKLTDEEIAELNLRMNKNHGSFDPDMLANFPEDLLQFVGWTDEELGEIFQLDLDDGDGFGDIPGKGSKNENKEEHFLCPKCGFKCTIKK